jgi:hypothetical protein
MAVTYTGIPGNAAPPAPSTISAIGLGGPPITITTTLAHGLTTGDVVDIRGIQGNAGTNVNRQWVATVTGGSTFTIPVASSGTYTSGGTVQALKLAPSYTYPSDGDADNQASILAWAKATGDRTQFLAGGVGVAKLAGRLVYSQSDIGNTTTWASRSVTTVANTWYSMGVSAGTLIANTDQAGCLSSAGGQPPIAIDGWYPALDCGRISMCTDALASATPMRFGLWYAVGPTGGALPAFPAAYNQIAYTSAHVSASPESINLEGLVPHTSAGGTLYLLPAFYSLAVATGVTIGLIGDTCLIVECWRTTGMFQ